jgi:uncharacterized protein with HEPN domain
MSATSLADHLSYMLQAARLACSYVDGMNKEQFLADTKTQQAVIMNLVIIGEAATRMLSAHAEFLEAHPDVQWKSMKGMRNRIAHGYFETNFDIVWQTVQTALPDLCLRLPAIVRAASATGDELP